MLLLFLWTSASGADPLSQAADSSSGFNPLSLVQYGVLGLVIVALLLGYLWTKPAVERLIADKERAEKARDDLFETIQKLVMPALAKAATSIDNAAQIMEETNRALDRAYETEGQRPRRRAAQNRPAGDSSDDENGRRDR